MESATESRLQRYTVVQVKRCGKSAPDHKVTYGAGKPHLEQGKTGTFKDVPVSSPGNRLRLMETLIPDE